MSAGSAARPDRERWASAPLVWLVATSWLVRVLGDRDGPAGDVGEGGQAEVDGCGPAGPLVELGEFLLGGGEADLEAFDPAEPAFALGFGDPGGQMVRWARPISSSAG